MAPWPPIPPGILSEDAPPAQRLRELAAFSRELLPIPNGGNNIWIFFPLEIANHAAFATLMEEVPAARIPLPLVSPPPLHHAGGSGRPRTAAGTRKFTRIEWYQPDLSAESINRSMEEEVADESLPLEERLGTLVVLAGNDFAFQRYAEALEKYELLLQYHAPDG